MSGTQATQLHKLLSEHQGKGYLMLCRSRSSESVMKQGVRPSQTYVITDVYKNQADKFIKVYNQFGGSQKAKDSLASTGNLKAAKGLGQVSSSGSQASSFIELEAAGQFRQTMEQCVICFYDKDFVYNYKEITVRNHKAQYLKFSIDRQLKVCVRLHQQNLFRSSKEVEQQQQQNPALKYEKMHFRLIQENVDGSVNQVFYNSKEIVGMKSICVDE